MRTFEGFGFVPHGPLKLIAAFALSAVGLYYVNQGRQQHDVRKMIGGSLIVVASLFLIL